MHHDLVISPFGASASDLVAVARCADEVGFDGIWTYDHLTGSMLGRGRSHDPFAILGAMAVATERVRLGPLVANMMNRHPVQLAVAMGTLQSLSGGRAVLGVGAGAAPGSRFAGEHEAIGTALLDGPARRRRLTETIGVVRALWAGASTFDGEFFSVAGSWPGIDTEPPPPIIVGASGARTVELAVAHADGVNLATGADRAVALATVAASAPAGFEVSHHELIDWSHPRGGTPPPPDGPITRRVLAVSAPFDLAAIADLGARLGR